MRAFREDSYACVTIATNGGQNNLRYSAILGPLGVGRLLNQHLPAGGQHGRGSLLDRFANRIQLEPGVHLRRLVVLVPQSLADDGQTGPGRRLPTAERSA